MTPKKRLEAIVSRLLEIEREIESLGDDVLANGNATPSLEVLGENLFILGTARFGLEKLVEDTSD